MPALLNRIRPRWWWLDDRLHGRRIPVFHHVPKCGGTSLASTLQTWWHVVRDYRKPENGELVIPPRHRIGRLTSRHCLVGHFDVPGYYLFERYPEVVKHRRFYLFSFLREPLDAKISLYYWWRDIMGRPVRALEDFLFEQPNYLSHRFPCDLSNYREVLARYDFLGLVEESDLGMQALARVFGKPSPIVPRLNVASRDSEAAHLRETTLREFRDVNALDYLVYAEARRRWEQIKEKMLGSLRVSSAT